MCICSLCDDVHAFVSHTSTSFWCLLDFDKSSVFVSEKEADLVTTHELGHNFGAEHDPDNIPYCAPSDDHGGKFVMYPIAVSGDHVNNKVPSPPKLLQYNDITTA